MVHVAGARTHISPKINRTGAPLKIHGEHGENRLRGDYSIYKKQEPPKKEVKSFYTADEIVAITEEWKSTGADKEFMKQDTKDTPFMTPETQKFVEASLNSLIILSFLGGPEGIVVAAGIAFASGMISLANSTGKKINDVAAEVHKLQGNKDLTVLLTNLRSFADAVDLRKDRFVSLEKYEEQLSAGSANPEGSLYANESVWLKPLIDWLRQHTLPGPPDRLASCANILGDLGEKTPWDRPDVRFAMLHADSLLFIAYKLLAICYARLAAGSRHHNNGQVSQEYFDNVCASHNALVEMKDAIAQKKTAALKKIEDLTKWRKEQVLGPKMHKEWRPAPPHDMQVVAVKDEWTSKNVVFKREDGDDPENFAPELKEISHAPIYGIPSKGSEVDGAGKVAALVEKERGEYMARLDLHIQRVFAADHRIIASWDKIAEQIQDLLMPPTPKNPPVHDPGYQHVSSPSAALHGYTKVAYRYSVTTVHGTSGYSPWTEPLTIDTDNHMVPVLRFGSSLVIIGYEPTVTIERRVWSPKESSGLPAEPPAIKAGVLEHLTSERTWIDQQNLPHGRA